MLGIMTLIYVVVRNRHMKMILYDVTKLLVFDNFFVLKLVVGVN